jgi:hypothetical protein
MVRVLLVVVVLMALAIPVFNIQKPLFFGIPFFYWYQLSIVPVSALLILIVHLAESGAGRNADR